MGWKDVVFGKPIATGDEDEEKVRSLRAIPILGLDALASAAYGPEALLTVLLVLGTGAYRALFPITVAIVALLALLFFSYRQTIDAYPNGGGSFVVAKENLGAHAGLLAAAALSLDYMLNVAVAISAGVGALVSAIPSLEPYTLPLCLCVLVVLTIVNLRGVRSTGSAWMIPTYLFLFTLGATLAVGLAKTLLSHGHPHAIVAPPPIGPTTETLTLWLLARAFANGTTAMTGVEAVSDGVPIFENPRTKHAKRTLAAIVGVLVLLLLGIAALCRAYRIGATPPGRAGYQSVLSQLVGAVFGRGLAYGVTLASIVAVLALSANTSFADFPRLWQFLGRDRFLPEAFAHRGRRLVFTHGILVLSFVSGVLLVVFQGVTDALIPLFAMGAILAFTLSQTGMVWHWRKDKDARHRVAKLLMNAVGAIATALTFAIVTVFKFAEGAWISVFLIAAMFSIFAAFGRHHRRIAEKTAPRGRVDLHPLPAPIVVVPIRRWTRVAQKALRFAVGLSRDVEVVQVLTEDRACDDLTSHWDEYVGASARAAGVPVPKLVVLNSQYRTLLDPILAHIGEIARRDARRPIAVIVPELVQPRWYHHIVGSPTAALLKALLVFKGGPRIVVIDAPWYLEPPPATEALAPERVTAPARPRPSRVSSA